MKAIYWLRKGVVQVVFLTATYMALAISFNSAAKAAIIIQTTTYSYFESHNDAVNVYKFKVLNTPLGWDEIWTILSERDYSYTPSVPVVVNYPPPPDVDVSKTYAVRVYDSKKKKTIIEQTEYHYATGLVLPGGITSVDTNGDFLKQEIVYGYPEPSTTMLVAIGIIGMEYLQRRKAQSTS